MKYRISRAPLHIAAVAAILAGCQTTPPANPNLESARRNVEQVRADPHVVRYAAVESEQAAVALQRAQRAHVEERDDQLTAHLAYLASQRAEVARNVAMQRAREDALQQASVERERIRAEVRAREAARAQVQANSAQQAAQTARAEAERLQTQLEELKARNTQRGMVLTLGDVLFDTGSAVLKPAGEQVVDRIAEVMRQHPQQRVLIEGHTDSQGSDDANVALSRRRAEAFAIPLIQDGVDPSRVEVVGRGEALPVASNDTAAGRQQNRRVEMVFSGPDGRFVGR